MQSSWAWCRDSPSSCRSHPAGTCCWCRGCSDGNDFDNAAVEKAFDVALHLGTLVAAILYFRKDLVVYIREGVRAVTKRQQPASPEGRLAWLLVLSCVPAAITGALFEKTIDHKLGKPALIAVGLILFGLLLWYADQRKGTRGLDDYTPATR